MNCFSSIVNPTATTTLQYDAGSKQKI